jgi:hypothetical protein
MEKNQFFELGCPQCHDLKMQENEGRVAACTTQDFEGIIANIRPGGFATRFTGLEKRMPGFYALVVRGEIPATIMMDDMDADLPDLVRDGSESPIGSEDDLFGRPDQQKAKKRKIASERSSQAGVSQPPSRDSSTSDAEHGNLLSKALDFIASESEGEKSDVDASGVPKDQIIPSASERTGGPSATSATERTGPSGSERITSASERTRSGPHDTASDNDARQKLSSGVQSASGAESQKSGQSRDSRHSRQSRDSAKSGTSRSSVAILEPEADTEFDRAPE